MRDLGVVSWKRMSTLSGGVMSVCMFMFIYVCNKPSTTALKMNYNDFLNLQTF